jgi:hypothetical protein
MSSFDGVPFKVIPKDGWFPAAEHDADGIPHYQCTAWLSSQSALQGLRSRLAFVTVKRGRGALAFTVHIEAGSPGALTVPVRGGIQQTYTAVLVGLTNVQGYGGMKKDQFMADLDFIITSQI